MFDQSPYLCKMEWGPRGAREAAERGEIVVIVDVLSFSSTVTAAAAHGAVIYPSRPPIDATVTRLAAALQAEIVLSRAEAAATGGHSLSPLTFTTADRGRKFVFCSTNGAASALAASASPAVLVGSLLNAASVARTANRLSRKLSAPVTVVPCGEQWSDALQTENRLRPGIEDYLGAGMIVSGLNGDRSPEADVCAAAYERTIGKLTELIRDCASGRELQVRGYERDVDFCLRPDALQAVPMLHSDGYFSDVANEV